ncbi:hypothetical protein Leryth_006974 [Lithospermum erythrorhizon]|uniref:HMG box domain-containing protein n=1 Tax=Lithospermum erythrorhizon TaxID=34254 RepID=A0AAV3PF59_LITER|nr:hypothetical protein Leryth_006974 [Lithospermum erythrorhizon]
MKGAKSKASARGNDSKLSVKSKPAKKAKAVKDPNKPKRPPSAFFVFMEDFRQEYKAKHPNNKAVSAVGKAGGERWKSLTDSEKAPYIAKADKRKADYEKTIKAYNKKQAGEAEEESDKSKSEVHDDDDDDEEGSDEEDEDDD